VEQWNDTDGECEELGEKPVLVPFCPPQILHGRTRARTGASAMKVQLTARALEPSYDI